MPDLKKRGGTFQVIDLGVDRLPVDEEGGQPPPESYVLVKSLAEALGVSRSALRHFLERRGIPTIKVRLYETGGIPTLALHRDNYALFARTWAREGRPFTPAARALLADGRPNQLPPEAESADEALLRAAALARELASLLERAAHGLS